jgi:hypothetical protein
VFTLAKTLEPADRYLAWRRAFLTFVIPTKGDAVLMLKVEQRKTPRAALTMSQMIWKKAFGNREIAVHGIDAWRDSAKGCDEREHIQEITARPRQALMHWLTSIRKRHRPRESGFLQTQRLAINEGSDTAPNRSSLQHPNVDRLLNSRCTSWTQRCYPHT